MKITNELTQWLQENSINYEVIGLDTISVDGVGVFMELVTKDNIIHLESDTLNLNLTKEVLVELIQNNIDFIVYRFGGFYYYTPISLLSDLKLTLFQKIGSFDGYVAEEAPVFLGVHGRYEIMNGTRDYGEWCEKALFLKYKYLGICEKHTLAGTLLFQNTCEKYKISPIIGYSVDIEPMIGDVYTVKLFVKDHSGWIRLLQINKYINVDQNTSIKESDFLNGDNKGLVAIIFPQSHVNEIMIDKYQASFDQVYYQLTTNQFTSNKEDEYLLENIQYYLNNKLYEKLPPILMSDAYVIEESDVHVKRLINKQSGQFHVATNDHYMKSMEKQFLLLESLFDERDERLESLFEQALHSLKQVSEICTYRINTSKLFLPQYELTEYESKVYGTNLDLFEDLIHMSAVVNFGEDYVNDNVITERLSREIDVIRQGGFIDYFLILWDIISFCRTNKIEFGPGRGSAGGSLVAYLLGITKINPLQYNLLFERFLNVSRIKSEMPDIDIDFSSNRRDDVIKYMIDRYGYEYVCRVGTYTTLQMKGVIKELMRLHRVNGKYNPNIITHLIQTDNTEWSSIFYDSIKNPLLRQFIVDNPHIINDARIILNTIKSTSIHACATIIVPKIKDEKGNDLNIYQQIPLRKDDDGTLVSEWEGEVMASAGYLKEDILSTRQMAKFNAIIELIERNTGKFIFTEDIDLDDSNVFDFFQQGYNQDVFHFGSSGLTSYLKELQPYSIHELIAAIALYRPGAMISNAHIDFIKLKRGDMQPQYDFLLEQVTKDTYGLYCYQEQIMQAVQILGGFDLVEADGVRKAMGKKIKEKMDGYREQFLKVAQAKGCPQKDADDIWKKLEVFSGYGFNKSHATAYAIIGYQCNWFKYYYPLEFWTVALEFCGDKNIPGFLSEIKKTGKIRINTPNINLSQLNFYSDVKTQTIYWNLTQISFVGEIAARSIIEERERGGQFFSIEEFVDRVDTSIVNKRTVENLILAGAFDQLYNVKSDRERYGIIQKYYDGRKDDIPINFVVNKNLEYFWSIQQNRVTGLNDMNYQTLIEDVEEFSKYQKQYVSIEESIGRSENDLDGQFVVSGILSDVYLRETKKDARQYIVGFINQEEHRLPFRIWPDELMSDDKRCKELIDLPNQVGKLCIFRGNLKYNNFVSSNELVLTTRIKGPIYKIL